MIDLSQSILSIKESPKKEKFPYEIAYATKKYHLVRNRNTDGDDSIQLLPNSTTTLEHRLPRVKMDLQTNRPPNLAQLHDARFETINRDPKILTNVRKVASIDFNKQDRTERHQCLINDNNEISMQKYQVKDDVLKKRATAGNISLDKQLNWSQILNPSEKERAPGYESYD